MHGTGKCEEGLEHIGIAILLSKDTKTSWEDYKLRVRDGELQGDDLLWNYGSGDDEESEEDTVEDDDEIA